VTERARIARYFAPLTAGEAGSFSLTDDAAILTPPAGQQLVITTDSVIENIHVLAHASAAQFARKLVRRNLSDLAAMGARPWRYSINLHTPRGLADDWFAEFAATLAEEQAHFNMVLIGGDSTSGDGAIHTTMTCFGLLEGTALRRNSAQAGDDLYVSGTLGDAALALPMLQHGQPVPEDFAARYHMPEPRLALGHALKTIATAALDISDGLLQDIAQLCRASAVGATLLRDDIPLSDEARSILAVDATAWDFILGGGDDYELAFTAPPEKRAEIAALAMQLNLPLTRIGIVTEGDEIQLLDEYGEQVDIGKIGWEYA
jgi:thiamine-monophosphate kinase